MNAVRWYVTLVTWAFVSACPAVAHPDAPGSSPILDEQVVRLAPYPGFADDAAFVASVTSRIAEFQLQAEESPDAVSKAGFLLAAANLILAEQLEPVCSRKFLMVRDSNLTPDQPRQSDEALSADHIVPTLQGVDTDAALDRADALLVEAAAILHLGQEHSLDENLPANDQAKGLNRSLVTLKAFSQALRAYLVMVADVDPSRAARSAASSLSVLMEDDDPRVAAAASFWQASLRAMETDPTPALMILARATADLPNDAPRIGFYSRLLRCRLVAGQGGWAAGLSLLMQVEERANVWFKDDTDRTEAVRSCAWFRLQTLQDWLDQLDPTAQADERAWCKSQIDALRTDRFSDTSDGTLLRLNHAIPMIALPPGTAAKPTEETPTPR